MFDEDSYVAGVDEIYGFVEWISRFGGQVWNGENGLLCFCVRGSVNGLLFSNEYFDWFLESRLFLLEL